MLAPAIGEDSLAIEIEIGTRISQGSADDLTIEEYLAAIVTFRRGDVVVTIEFGFVPSESNLNPLGLGSFISVFFDSSGEIPASIARSVDARLLAELTRVKR